MSDFLKVFPSKPNLEPTEPLVCPQKPNLEPTEPPKTEPNLEPNQVRPNTNYNLYLVELDFVLNFFLTTLPKNALLIENLKKF